MVNKMKNFNELCEFLKNRYSVEPEFPWEKDPESAVFRHINNNKWFVLYMVVNNDKLGFENNGVSNIINLKCYPEMIGTLRMKEGILPAYHMNKEHWISLILDGKLNDSEILSLIDISYELTKK